MTVIKWLLTILFLLLVGELLLQLLRAGEATIGIITALVSLFATLVSFLPRAAPDGDHRLIRLYQTLLPGILIVGLLLLRGAIFDLAAAQQIERILTADTASETIRAAENAEAFGADVSMELETWLTAYLDKPDAEVSLNRSVTLLETYAAVASPEDIAAFSTRLANQIREDIATGIVSEEEVTLFNKLDPEASNTLADSLNDSGQVALAANDLVGARVQLETAALIDQVDPTLRDAEHQAATLHNLGQLYEVDLSLENNSQLAIDTYRRIIAIHPNDVEAYYAMAALSLRQENYVDAVNIAEQGRTFLPDACEGVPTAFESDIDALLCYFLLTTEAGGRYNQGDSLRLVQTLAARATDIAAAFDHFEPNYYTAEAYYYLALSSEALPDKDTLCAIIFYHDESDDMQQEWADYARVQLGDYPCFRD
ncbi:MAG: hypothetical protein CL607_00075 [Anaerolineaceae bacterium]|nr:hypothetical protein [Anaerolineaceae bacterium]